MTEKRGFGWLRDQAKTAYQIHDLVRNNLHHTVDLKDYKWVSLDNVKELLGGCQEPRKEKKP